MKFEKVSFEQFNAAIADIIKTDVEEVQRMYDEIKIPRRATKKSAGYDFFLPFPIKVYPQTSMKIPTGIRVLLDDDKHLEIFPRSGLGFKYKLRLNNTVGIIDADYSDSDNEGHIFIKIANEGTSVLTLEEGDAFAQGVITRYYLVEDDYTNTVRNGGFGSTS